MLFPTDTAFKHPSSNNSQHKHRQHSSRNNEYLPQSRELGIFIDHHNLLPSFLIHYILERQLDSRPSQGIQERMV